MATEIHFVDVGQGNMVLIKTDDDRRFVFDCNIHADNEKRVLRHVERVFGSRSIYAFICSHRDSDHIRGIKRLHENFPIQRIWDSGHPGTSTGTPEYLQYMNLRRQVSNRVIQKQKYEDYGRTRFRYLSAMDSRLEGNANAQGIVLKVEQRSFDMSRPLGSAILPGDSDAATWRKGILMDYDKAALSADILMAAHHGSITFFDDDGYSTRYYYKEHLKAINPAMTIISVGPNNYGHPNETALKMYRKESRGSDAGAKLARTDQQHTMKLVLKETGGWVLSYNQ